MSHRKFEAPRHGHLGFVPRHRSKRPGARGRVRNWPKDNPKDKVHLTAFLGYKAGMTHIVREVNKVGSKIHKKEVVEAVTIIETPPMVVVGLKAFYQSPFGPKSLGTVWAHHLSTAFRRRFVSKWSRSAKSAFSTHSSEYYTKLNRRSRRFTLEKFVKYGKVVRLLAHTQIGKIRIGNKKAHLAEIQINGGSVAQKVKFGYQLLEKFVAVDQVFKVNEMIDIIGISKGKGFNGVIKRFGVRRLPRKTHKGLRKVACIGAWHPARVSWAVARAGQMGYHNRTLANKKIYLLGKSIRTPEGRKAGMTSTDLTEKSINPMGSFKNYGTVREDFVMVKGSVLAPPKRVVVLRKGILPSARTSRAAQEEITLKFIDTASKIGVGHFQTHKEKRRFLGPLKKEKLRKQKKDLATARAEKAAAPTEGEKKQ